MLPHGVYLVVQVPIMLILAMVLANLLNDPKLKGSPLAHDDLPAVAVSLVSYSLVFRTMFATDGPGQRRPHGGRPHARPAQLARRAGTARFVIVIGLLWRWTGYNMIFFLAAAERRPLHLEAARIDGAGAFKTFWFRHAPQLRPMIVLTAIMSINGTLQLFDESWAPPRAAVIQSMSMSHYLYELAFLKNQRRLRLRDLVRDPDHGRGAGSHPDEGG
jgi:lactose/L-arabinose transport system permease protein